MKINKLFTSESVGKGHPDKICDQIADLILDECLKQDSNSRVACEVLGSNGLIVISGEITTKAYVDVVKTAWRVLKPLGYTENEIKILSHINQQSPNISKMVNRSRIALGAGDQGIVFGYATNKTTTMMPLSMVLANELVVLATKLIKQGKFPGAKYDMKSQVTVDWTDDVPRIDTMIMSIQHEADVNRIAFKKFVLNKIMIPTAAKYDLNIKFKTFINHSGDFIIGGLIGDTGLTGRKNIVDTYGGAAHHGGGSFSGKDYTKVDRTGAYFARYIAKNIVAAKLASRCEIQLAFAIGSPKPVSMLIDTFNTNTISLDKIYRAVNRTFDFDLYNIVKTLKLDAPIYHYLSVFGHFGRTDLDLSWEQTDKVNALIKNSK